MLIFIILIAVGLVLCFLSKLDKYSWKTYLGFLFMILGIVYGIGHFFTWF